MFSMKKKKKNVLYGTVYHGGKATDGLSSSARGACHTPSGGRGRGPCVLGGCRSLIIRHPSTIPASAQVPFLSTFEQRPS